MEPYAKTATKEEILEVEQAIIGASGLTVEYVGYQDFGSGQGIHLYNLVNPRLPQYNYSDGLPTFSIHGLRELGLIKPVEKKVI